MRELLTPSISWKEFNRNSSYENNKNSVDVNIAPALGKTITFEVNVITDKVNGATNVGQRCRIKVHAC